MVAATIAQVLIARVMADRKPMATQLVLVDPDQRRIPAAAAAVTGVAGHLGRIHNSIAQGPLDIPRAVAALVTPALMWQCQCTHRVIKAVLDISH
jgi:hypothetical protein